MSVMPALMAAAVIGAPIAYPSFPASQGFTAVARWLEREGGATRRDLVAVRDNLAWIMTPEGRYRQAGQPAVLRLEALDAAAWKRLGGRSAIVRLDADCAGHRGTIRNAEVYQASNLLGDVTRNVEPSALPILPDTLAAVADSICRGGAQAPLTVAQASTAIAPIAPVTPLEPARPPPAPPPPPTLPLPSPAPPAPTPSRPPPIERRPVEVAPPAPAAVVSPPPRVVAPPPAPPVPAPPRAPETSVQIGTFGDTGGAMVALRELAAAQPKLMAGKLQRLEPFAVSGGQLYRALLTGFSSAAEADTFCRALVAGGKPCVVRPAP